MNPLDPPSFSLRNILLPRPGKPIHCGGRYLDGRTLSDAQAQVTRAPLAPELEQLKSQGAEPRELLDAAIARLQGEEAPAHLP